MGARRILVEGYIQSNPEQVDLIGIANDAPSRKHPVPAASRWLNRPTTTAANTSIVLRKKSVEAA